MPKEVTRRLVFYCPGYDAEAETRYRRLLGIGLGQLRKRRGFERKIGPVEADPTVPSVRWTILAQTPNWRTETLYEVLRWDDLVKRDFGRTWRERIPLLFTCMLGALRDGVIPNLFRIDWHFACLVIFPWVALSIVVLAALAVGWVAAWLIVPAVKLGAGVKALVTLAVALGVIAAAHPLLKRSFVYFLLEDWIFNWQHGNGQRPDIDTRLDSFSERIVAAVRETTAQEVLIVGHSSGSILAVEITARALAHDPQFGERGPVVALLTIGAELPVAGFLRKATRFREAVVSLATAPSLLWVEYQAPQDWLNAFQFEPVRDLRLDLGGRAQTNPQIRSPRFKETVSPQAYRKMKWKFLRVHFQFLMPVDVPGEYDYPMIVCGPVSLADRIADPKRAVRVTEGSAPAPADARA